MTKKEFIRAIKAARKVYVWAKFTAFDGEYVQVVKKNLLRTILNDVDTHTFTVRVEFGYLWVG